MKKVTFKRIQKLRKIAKFIRTKLGLQKKTKKASPTLVLRHHAAELRQKSNMMEEEIVTMKNRIDHLECERKRLLWALNTLETREDTLDITPPPPMTPIKESSIKVRQRSRDSAYFSADTSPHGSPIKLPKPTFDNQTGCYMSNGFNTYYLAV